MIGFSKKNTENYRRKYFSTVENDTRLKFNLGLALIGLQTTGPWVLKSSQEKLKAMFMQNFFEGKQGASWEMCKRQIDHFRIPHTT